jgi:nicotinamide riboside kinase
MLGNAGRLLFCDTEMIVNKIWCEDKYGKCHQWISDAIERYPYDLYLLCNTDIPWQPDPMRENPADRDRLFILYLNELESRSLPYSIIKGTAHERLERAMAAVEQLLDSAGDRQ